MDFAWSDEQAAFRKEVLRFATEELKDDVIARDQNEEFSKDLVAEMRGLRNSRYCRFQRNTAVARQTR